MPKQYKSMTGGNNEGRPLISYFLILNLDIPTLPALDDLIENTEDLLALLEIKKIGKPLSLFH